MAKPKEPFVLQKVTLNLRAGDWLWLRIMHGRRGAGAAIREMVMRHVERVEAELKRREADD